MKSHPAKISRPAKEPTRAQLESLFWLSLLTSLGLYLFLFLGAGLLADFYDTPTLAPLIRVQGLGVVLFALYFIPKALLTRELKFGRITFADNRVSSTGVIQGWGIVGGAQSFCTGNTVSRYSTPIQYCQDAGGNASN